MSSTGTLMFALLVLSLSSLVATMMASHHTAERFTNSPMGLEEHKQRMLEILATH